ncbi:MAG: trxA [Chitinophagaceae bacterium]|nr:trxA [Chitinophagaceae bacterium]
MDKTNVETFQDLIGSSVPVLVDFYADWCGPCKAMNPVIKEVAQKLEGKARIIKVNIDKAEETAIKYGVSAVPTFMLFKQGQILWRHAGMIDKDSLLKTIEANR